MMIALWFEVAAVIAVCTRHKFVILELYLSPWFTVVCYCNWWPDAQNCDIYMCISVLPNVLVLCLVGTCVPSIIVLTENVESTGISH